MAKNHRKDYEGLYPGDDVGRMSMSMTRFLDPDTASFPSKHALGSIS